MLILIEGNEGSGKTTLINNLLKKLPIVTIKYSKDCKKINTLYQLLYGYNDYVVFDRSFITDLVYRIYDKKVGQMSLKDIGTLFDAFEIKIIFCTNEDGFENAISRGEENIKSKAAYESINQIYDNVLSMIKSFEGVEIRTYNYRYDTVDDMVNFIKGGE